MVARALRANAAVSGPRSRAASDGALSDKSVNALGWNLRPRAAAAACDATDRTEAAPHTLPLAPVAAHSLHRTAVGKGASCAMRTGSDGAGECDATRCGRVRCAVRERALVEDRLAR